VLLNDGAAPDHSLINEGDAILILTRAQAAPVLPTVNVNKLRSRLRGRSLCSGQASGMVTQGRVSVTASCIEYNITTSNIAGLVALAVVAASTTSLHGPLSCINRACMRQGLHTLANLGEHQSQSDRSAVANGVSDPGACITRRSPGTPISERCTG
jgi:hypothetical protein